MSARARATMERFLNSRWASTVLVLATLAVGILIGTIISNGVKGRALAAFDSSDATPLQLPAPKQLSNAFATIAKQVEPSVVNINTESISKPEPAQRRRRGQPPDDDNQSPFDDFFDRFFGGQGGPPPEGSRERALGSGVIMDTKGYIVTNAHVVDGADRIKVKLMDDPPGDRLSGEGHRRGQGNRLGGDQN